MVEVLGLGERDQEVLADQVGLGVGRIGEPGRRARIDQTMDLIQERYRLAIELRLVQELSREDCAQRLGVAIGTFDVLLFRAVRAFRKCFGERDRGEALASSNDGET